MNWVGFNYNWLHRCAFDCRAYDLSHACLVSMSHNFPSCTGSKKYPAIVSWRWWRQTRSWHKDGALAQMRDTLLSCPVTSLQQLIDDKSADFRLTTPSLLAHQSRVIITPANDNNVMARQIINIKQVPWKQLFFCRWMMFLKEVIFPSRNVWMEFEVLPNSTDFISRPLRFPFERLAQLFELQNFH